MAPGHEPRRLQATLGRRSMRSGQASAAARWGWRSGGEAEPASVPLAVLGFLWSWLDHAANNQLAIGGRDGSNVVVSVWRTIERNGFLSRVSVPWSLPRRSSPTVGPCAPPRPCAPALPPTTVILERWRWIRARRALAFAASQLRGYGGRSRPGLAGPAADDPVGCRHRQPGPGVPGDHGLLGVRRSSGPPAPPAWSRNPRLAARRRPKRRRPGHPGRRSNRSRSGWAEPWWPAGAAATA